MSTIASTEPTSWNSTSSAGMRCIVPSTSASMREGSLGAVANALGQIGGVDQLADRAGSRDVGVLVVARDRRSWSSVEHDDVGLCRGDAAAHHVLERQRVAVEVEPADELGDHQRVGAGIDQRRHRHVAGGAGEAVEPGGSGHCIILAIAHAAPNPLSIPTTVTPLAHEACIASSAVIAVEARPVADAGRHGDDRPAGQAADHAGQRALHPGDHDHRIGGRDAVEVGEQPVQPGDADVGQPVGVEAVGAQGQHALVDDRAVAGAGAGHQHPWRCGAARVGATAGAGGLLARRRVRRRTALS